MTDHHDSTGNIKDDTPGPQTPGQMVRAQREAAGLSLQAVSEALHLTVHYIKSLEGDEYNKLPGLTFVKGYFRAYARYLRMDVDAVLASYERYLVAKGFRQHTHDFSSGSASIGSIGGRRSDQSFAWALVAGVILIIALAAGWWFFGREMEVAVASRTTTTAPATPVTSATSAAPQTSLQSANTQSATQPLVQSNNTAVQPSAVAPITAATFPQTVAANAIQNPPPVVSATVMEGDAQAAAADAGAAVINATLEARQEEADLANAAQLAAEQLTASANAALNTAADATAGVVANATTAVTSAAVTGAAALGSYTAPAANAATTAVALTDAVQSSAAIAADADGIDNPAAEITTGTSGTRNITLRGAGNDRLEIQLSGASWAEIRDSEGADLFSDMLRQGDRLTIEGSAPFSVLLGDARQAQTSFNAQSIDMSSLVRSDNTARFRLAAEGVTAILRDQTVVTE